MRIVGEQRARAREHIFRRIAAEVPKHLAVILDDLLVVSPDENVSSLQIIKANPSKPSVDAMLRLNRTTRDSYTSSLAVDSVSVWPERNRAKSKATRPAPSLLFDFATSAATLRANR